MKRMVALLFCVLFLVGCGNEVAEGVKEKQIIIENSKISLGDEMKSVENALGKEYKLTESESCLYEGMDKVFEYDKITITTYPNGENDYVSSILFSDKEVLWMYDVQVGDSIDDIRAIFKEEKATQEDYLWSYEMEGYGISFYLSDNKITEIEIYLLEG